MAKFYFWQTIYKKGQMAILLQSLLHQRSFQRDVSFCCRVRPVASSPLSPTFFPVKKMITMTSTSTTTLSFGSPYVPSNDTSRSKSRGVYSQRVDLLDLQFRLGSQTVLLFFLLFIFSCVLF